MVIDATDGFIFGVGRHRINRSRQVVANHIFLERAYSKFICMHLTCLQMFCPCAKEIGVRPLPCVDGFHRGSACGGRGPIDRHLSITIRAYNHAIKLSGLIRRIATKAHILENRVCLAF